MSRRWKQIKGTPAESHPSVFVLIGPDKEVRKILMVRLLDHVVNGGSVSEHMRQTVAILSTFEEAEKNRLQYLNAWASERALDTSLESLEGFMERGECLAMYLMRMMSPLLRPLLNVLLFSQAQERQGLGLLLSLFQFFASCC